MNETYITVNGNLTADPDLQFTPSGHAVASFTVATTPRIHNKERGEWEDGDTTFIRCQAWRQMGENVAESLIKGMGVVVYGTLAVRTYDRNDGSKGTSVEVNVINVGPSLQRATAKVERNPRREPQRQQPRDTQRPADTWDEEPPF
jgi:single-strand DNA-binding protein